VRFVRLALAVSCIAAAGARSAGAQDVPNPEEAGRYRLGPVRFTPTVEIRNVGVDTNIFNNADDPKQDFVASFGPGANYWMRAGRTRLAGHTGLQYDYFQEYATQRAFGTNNRVKLELASYRFTPFIEGAYDNTRRRPDYEIDARARYRTDAVTLGTDVRLFSRSVLRLEAERGHLDYDQGQLFGGVDLSDVMDRTDTAYRVSVRHAVTPLTTFIVTGEQRTYRFRVSRDRDTNGFRLLPGFELKPGALITGKAAVGYASFRTLDTTVPDFTGVVANVEVSYTARASRMGLHVVREPNYSYELQEPFYVVTDTGLQFTQKVTTNWDMLARGTRQWLGYRHILSEAATSRTDRVWRIGGGTGRWFGQVLRIGFDLEYAKRDSPLLSRAYDGWRLGGNITYGSQNQ
jgi:hypothetical protein